MERRKRFAGGGRMVLCVVVLLSVVGLLTTEGGASSRVRTLGVVDFYAVTPLGSFEGSLPERFAADDLSDLLIRASGGQGACRAQHEPPRDGLADRHHPCGDGSEKWPCRGSGAVLLDKLGFNSRDQIAEWAAEPGFVEDLHGPLELPGRSPPSMYSTLIPLAAITTPAVGRDGSRRTLFMSSSQTMASSRRSLEERVGEGLAWLAINTRPPPGLHRQRR
jgi:hypothetical protein